MTVYVLNTPVLTSFGIYEYRGPITVEDARALLDDGFESAIGHPGAAVFLSSLLQIPIAEHRCPIQMAPGDRALVLKLAPGQRLPIDKKEYTVAEMSEMDFELGVLTRIRDRDV